MLVSFYLSDKKVLIEAFWELEAVLAKSGLPWGFFLSPQHLFPILDAMIPLTIMNLKFLAVVLGISTVLSGHPGLFRAPHFIDLSSTQEATDWENFLSELNSFDEDYKEVMSEIRQWGKDLESLKNKVKKNLAHELFGKSQGSDFLKELKKCGFSEVNKQDFVEFNQFCNPDGAFKFVDQVVDDVKQNSKDCQKVKSKFKELFNGGFEFIEEPTSFLEFKQDFLDEDQLVQDAWESEEEIESLLEEVEYLIETPHSNFQSMFLRLVELEQEELIPEPTQHQEEPETPGTRVEFRQEESTSKTNEPLTPSQQKTRVKRVNVNQEIQKLCKSHSFVLNSFNSIEYNWKNFISQYV